MSTDEEIDYSDSPTSEPGLLEALYPVSHAAALKAERAAGWREAIEALRDDDRYAAWDLAQVEPRTPLQAVHRDVAADYLETLSTGDAP